MNGLILALFLAQQNDPAKLVELLRSDLVVERDDAFGRLRELGERAVPALEEAVRDPDSEVSGLAREILRRIEIRRSMSPALRKALPLAETRIYVAGSRAWAAAFLEAVELPGPGLGRQDLDPLAGFALAGAEGTGDLRRICEAVRERRLRGAVPELRKLLKHSSRDIIAAVVETLGWVGTRELVPEILPLLEENYLYLRGSAAAALGRLGAKEAVPALLERLKDPQPYVRRHALDALGRIGAPESAPVFKALLKDPELGPTAARWLCTTGDRDGVPLLLKAWDFAVSTEGSGRSTFGAELDSLNAVRNPEAWKRLAGKRWEEDLSEFPREAAERLAAAAGMNLEWKDAVPGAPHFWSPFRRTMDGMTLLEALEALMADLRLIILEKDLIRIVPRDEGLKFWKDWWAAESAAKK